MTGALRNPRRKPARPTWLWLVGLAAGALSACADDPVALAPPDRATFDNVIYPILLQDCAFSTCHGAPDRVFHVFGPGRTRLDPAMENFAAATPAEKTLAYSRTIAMLDAEGRESATLLLMKPLDPEAGGAGHQGEDHFGRDVYPSQLHPRYAQLRQWALTRGVGAP